jgi:hypothetical protein
VVALVLLFVFTAPAAAFTSTQTLTESSPAEFDAYGTAVAISGSTMVVGAPNAGTYGEVDVYTQASDGKWDFLQTLTASQAEQFGQSVAISGNTIVVGAPGGSSSYDNGSVWIYSRTSDSGDWPTSATQTLAAASTSPSDLDEFGYSVAISGNLLAVGAPNAGDTNGGGVQVYTDIPPYGYDSGNPGILVDPSDGDDMFGYSVAIAGDTVFVGAPTTTQTIHSESGAAYYETDVPASGQDWTNTTLETLTPVVGVDAEFGYALAADDSTLIVGVPGEGGSAGGDEGEGVAFNISNVATTAPTATGSFQPTESSDTSSPQFGSSVAVYGSSIALGAETTDGTACLFSTGSSSTCTALGSDLWGGGVALSATTVAAGGPSVSNYEGEVGSFFTAPPPPPPTAAQILASLKALLSPSGKTIKEIYNARSYSFSYTALEKGKLQLAWYDGRKELADGTLSVSGAGKHSIKVSLTKAGKKLFKSAHKLKLKSSVSFTPSGGKAVTDGKSFTLH